MPQIFDIITNENARYKRNELEFRIYPPIKRCFMCEPIRNKQIIIMMFYMTVTGSVRGLQLPGLPDRPPPRSSRPRRL